MTKVEVETAGGRVKKERSLPPFAGGGWGEGGPQSLLEHARTMRRTATPAERKLWQGLRKHQLNGLKFRRQMPLGWYIADFYCAAARLVVEVDGVSHIELATEAIRDVWMEKQCIRILRFSNFEVLSNLEGVLIAIQQVACSTPSPNPLPQGEGEF